MSDHDEAGTEPAGEGAPGPELRGDDFVARLVSDPKSPPQTTLISGYLGASDEEGHTRVYFNPELSDYVDVPNGDILHTEHPGEGPLAAALVWIKRDSQVLHGQAGAARRRAGFFEGRVWQDNFGATAATAAPAPGTAAHYPTPATHCFVCPPVRQPPRNQFAQGGPGDQFGPAGPGGFEPAIPSRVIVCMQSVFCRTRIPAICRPIPRSPWCPPVSLCPPQSLACQPDFGGTVRVNPGGPQWLQGSGGGTDTVLYGSGGGTDTVVYGSGGGTDTVLYGSGGGTDTVYYGSGGGTDTVLYGSTGGGTDTVFYGSGQGTDTVWYGSGMMTDTVHYGSGTGTDTVIYGSGGIADTVYYGSGQGTDTVYYGSGGGTDTVYYGSGMMTDTVYYGSGQGTDTVYYGSGGIADTVYYGSGGGADTVVYGSGGGGFVATIYQGGILPTRICPSAPCGGFPRRPFRTQVGPCGFPTLGPRGCASAVDACPTRFCPQW